jgi:HK97 family phage prohead protease
MILHRTFRAQLEAGDGRTLEGCCVPYGEAAQVSDAPDGAAYYEVFEPGAFKRQARAANRLELRYEHRDGLADSIGVCRELHEESSGLYGVFQVHGGPFGDQALELVREGILPGFSIGFTDRYTHWKRTPEGTVVRRSCELHEISLVRSPAYQGAVITAQRHREVIAAELVLPMVVEEQRDRLRAVGIRV